MLDRLPLELVRYIYEFDPTYHDQYNKVIQQIRRYTSLSLYIQLMHNVPMQRWSLSVRTFLMHTNKTELKEFSKFYFIVVPRHITKQKMFMRIYKQYDNRFCFS